ASAVRKGRREEFKAAYAALGDAIPDPLAEDTFRMAVLDWDARASPAGRQRLALVRELLALRQRGIAPRLPMTRFAGGQPHDRVLPAPWRLGTGQALLFPPTLPDGGVEQPPHTRAGRPIGGGEPASTLPPWAVFWSIGGG